MGTFEINGENRLGGNITPQGAKNEALQVLCATILTPEEIVIKNIPDIIDVNNMILLLQKLGVTVTKTAQNEYKFKADSVDLDYLFSTEYYQIASRLRGSVMLLGPLLARFGKGAIPSPGGDKIGRRRIDTHFFGLRKLGTEIHFDDRLGIYVATADKMEGSYMLLDEASVTGTANIIMASVFARGTTVIFNAACEPYVQQLCKMLVNMGAHISGIGSNLIHIHGTDQLVGCQHKILPDIIEVGSFIGMAAMTKSDLTIKDVSLDYLGNIPYAFQRLGIKLQQKGQDIYIPQQEYYEIETFIEGSIMTISDAPWPGITPDLLSVMLVVATQAKGSVLIHQKMFESRLFFVDKLIDMGAQIILCDPHRATVIGLNNRFPLQASSLSSPDIRAGIALLIAALSARGTSFIHNIEQIDRGYERIEERLQSIGAKIKRIE